MESLGSEHLKRNREVSELEEELNEWLIPLMSGPLKLDQNGSFKPTEFSRGLVAGIEHTGISFAIIAHYFSSYPEETKKIIADDLLGLIQNPEQAIKENTDLALSLGEDWWKLSEEEQFENFSFDMGKLTGVLLARILTRGLATTEALVYITPASGQAQRLAFLGEMAQEEYTPDLQKAFGTGDGLLTELWEKTNQRICSCYDPLRQNAYADCMKNIYLSTKKPSEHPIKIETARFLRDEFVEILYEMILEGALDATQLLQFAEAFSAMGAVMYGSLNESSQVAGFALFDKGHPPSKTQMNGMKNGYTGLIKHLEADELPPKELVLMFTESILQYYFLPPE